MNRIAWHFLRADWTTYGNGTDASRIKVEIGKPLVHAGVLNPCYDGLHASTRAIDALSYSHGPIITLVECEGEFIDHGNPADKFVCRKRTPLWGYDCADELWTFARLCALDSLEFWPDAPAVVREFLETGNQDLRAAAWAAVRDAARDAKLDHFNQILESLLFDGAVSRGLIKEAA